MSTDRVPFDLAGPLPSGLTVLEASAGTGKTYALSALAVRYVAELAVPASALCIVSFTEAATAEVRGRVRRRMADVADALDGPDGPDGIDDDVVRAVASGCDAVELGRRVARLRTAVADFDAATITTIHGFCGRVLALGGDPASDGTLSRSMTDVDEAVNDLLLACADPELDPLGLGDRTADAVDGLSAKRVVQAVRAVLQLPDAELVRLAEPAPLADDAPVRVRSAFHAQHRAALRANTAADLVERAARVVLQRRRDERRRTIDRVVIDARDLLARPESRGLVATLRQRYRVVLIDEFQDTDRVQWELFHRAFVDGDDGPAVVLVGDPKQSIYRFRGAELSAYLDAVGHAGAVRTLQRNWRSDEPLLRGLEQLFDGVTFGDDEVVFQPVEAAPDRGAWALNADPGAVVAPVDVRVVPQVGGRLTSPVARSSITADLVATVARLLGERATIVAADGVGRPLRASDIAVLTRTNAEATTVVGALAAAGIAAATSGATSVVATEAWQQWRRLLLALERPGSSGAVRAAAIGWFGGQGVVDLVEASDAELAELHARMRSWSALLATRGVPALLAAARAHGLQARLLARHGGERDLTDVEHIAELLNGATGGRPVSAGALRRLVDDPDVFGAADDTESLSTRRVDRDDDAVQVFTTHRAKGLEFAVVLCPYLWAAGKSDGVDHAVLDGRRRISSAWVAGTTLDPADELRRAVAAELDGEQRRLLYVALTRARQCCVLWWAPLPDRWTSVLGDVLAQAAGIDHRPTSAGDLAALAHRAPGALAVRELVPVEVAPLRAISTGGMLEVSTVSRVIDRTWKIWSFSSIKAAGDDQDRPIVGGADEPAAARDADEVGTVDLVASARVARPLAAAPGGTEFGTLVHQVLEQVDFTSPTLLDDLAGRCATALRHRSLRIAAPDLAAGLATAIGAPLGGPLGHTRLADLARSQRLDELVFDLPLGRLRAGRIGEVLAGHLPADDPLLPWARRLATASRGVDVEGMLTGSIDLVARTADGSRFWVADYKTNQLGITCAYGRADLVAAMEHHDYPLQAVLYMVALHRFLRWRLSGYRPDDHLLGSAYLFLRGMGPVGSEATAGGSDTTTDEAGGGAGDPTPGVFWWRPPTAAIADLDRLLADGVMQ